jgi:hypothetical protein
VNVGDVNDNIPSIGQTIYNVTEGVMLGMQVVDLDLRDDDLNTVFNVSIVRAHRHGPSVGRQLLFDVDTTTSGSPMMIPNLPFRISDNQTGLVTTADVDYETAFRYELVLTVSDQGGLQSNATVNIYITDIDEVDCGLVAPSMHACSDLCQDQGEDFLGYRSEANSNGCVGTCNCIAGCPQTFHRGLCQNGCQGTFYRRRNRCRNVCLNCAVCPPQASNKGECRELCKSLGLAFRKARHYNVVGGCTDACFCN